MRKNECMGINDVLEKIKSYSDEAELGVIVIEGSLETTKPELSVAINMFRAISERADDIKLKYIFKGLAQGNNVERRINELYTYVNSPQRAFRVSNLFRQALLSHSPIVCCILGIILGEQLDDQTDIGYENLIIMNALQTATDFEIKYLRDIYENYIDDGYIDTKAIEKIDLGDQYMMTLDWLKNNRVIGITGIREGKGFTVSGEYLIVNSITEKLLNYIYKARQVFKYEE